MPKLIVDNDEKEEKLSDVFMVTREFQTSAEFSQHIEKRAVQGGNYIDVLVEYCTRKEIEIESIGKFLTSNLKAKIKEEALDLNLLKEKKKSKLPL